MPIETSGPRLWFRQGNKLADGSPADGYWIIKDDNGVWISTGVRSARGGSAPSAAQEALARYILGRHKPPQEKGLVASSVSVADVIRLYLDDCAPKQAREAEVLARGKALLEFWGDKLLSDVTGRSCRAYVKHRDKPVARRELEDLRAAINYHRAEGYCREVVEVVLPERGAVRERWITRNEAARLIWAAWRYREVQKGKPTGRRSRQHIARFILVALYTGTRAGAVCGASLLPATHTGWVDLDRGIFYRKASAEKVSKKRKPPVKISPRLLGHMRRWGEAKPATTTRPEKPAQRYAVEWNGKPIGTGIEKAFKGVCESQKIEGVTPHTLRHTAATWLMQRGTDLWEAAGFLGMTVETLERVYGHHHPDFQSKAAENITRK